MTGNLNSGGNSSLTVDGGSLSLSVAGSLSTGYVHVGGNGSDVINQSGGNFTCILLFVGNDSGSGRYTLSGTGSSLSAEQVFVGVGGSGVINQSGGTFTCTEFGLGYGSVPSTYTLGGGTLNTATVTGGYGSIGIFNFNGGTLQAGPHAGTDFFQNLGTANVQSGGAVIDTQGRSVTVAQNLLHDTTSGAPATDGGLTKLGSGTLVLTGANTYTGATTISAGTLEATSPGALPGYHTAGQVSVSGGATLAAAVGGSGQWTAADLDTLRANVSFGGGAVLGLDTGGAGAGGFTYASNIGGSLSLTKLGAGTLTLTGLGTYNGATVSAGTLAIGSGGSLSGGGDLTVQTGGTFTLVGTGTLSATIEGVGVNSAGVFTQGGGTNTVGDTLYVSTGSAGQGTYNLNGGILQPVRVTTGNGSGIFNFNGGTLQAGPHAGTDFFQNLGTANVQSGGAVIDTQGRSVTVAQNLLHDTTSGAPATDGGLTKVGPGTLFLNGANTYTGTTTVGAGTLDLANSLALQNSTLALSGVSGSGVVTFDSGVSSNAFTLGGLSGNGNLALVNDASSPAAVALTVGSLTINAGSTTFAGNLSGSGSLTVGLIKLTLTGNNTYTGSTTFALGTLYVGSAGALGGGGVLSFTGGVLGYTASNQTDYSNRFSTAANQAYNIDTNGQNVTLASNLTSSGGILGKVGGGTLTLTGNNTYTGSTSIDGGALNVGSAGALGSKGLLILQGGTLQYSAKNQTDYSSRLAPVANQFLAIDTNGQSVTFAAALTSSGGTLTKLGSGTLTLTGTDTYTGATTINAGTLLAANTSGSATGTGAVTVTNAGSVLGGTGTVAGAVTVNSGVALLGGNGSDHSGALTLQGALTLNTGSVIELALGAAGAHSTLARIGSGAWSFAPNQAFAFVNSGASQPGLYDNILTGLAADPGGEASWTITNAGYAGTFRYDGAGDIDLTLTQAAVPEPATWLGGVLLLGVAGRSVRRRRW